jgi:hypothetical protein
MRSPDGRPFRIHVDIGHLIGLHARRHEYRGGWSFERSSASLRYPGRWHGHEACTIHQNSGAW